MQDRFEVHTHDDGSNLRLLDSINKPEGLLERAKEIGLRGFCITNHEFIGKSVVYNKMQKALIEKGSSFTIGLGNEIYLVDDRENYKKRYHFILIAKDEIGFRQLSILSTWAWLKEGNVVTTKSDLRKVVGADPGHLIATSACLGGELSTSALSLIKTRAKGDKQGEVEAYLQMENFFSFVTDVFGDDFYIEVAPGQSEEQILVNKKLVQVAKAKGIKVVLGCDAHYLRKEDRYVHKSYLNAQQGDREVDSFYEYAYMQSEEEILENLMPSVADEYETMCANSMEIFDKIQFYNLEKAQHIPEVAVPEVEKRTPESRNIGKYPTLSKLIQSDSAIDRYWVNECLDSLERKGLSNETYLERLEYEADIKDFIGQEKNTNMFAYPITLQHYIDLIWRCGSTIAAGRGSAGAGLNHFLLDVTQVNPVEWNLPFFRYLNKERVELGGNLCQSPSCKKRA